MLSRFDPPDQEDPRCDTTCIAQFVECIVYSRRRSRVRQVITCHQHVEVLHLFLLYIFQGGTDLESTFSSPTMEPRLMIFHDKQIVVLAIELSVYVLFT